MMDCKNFIASTSLMQVQQFHREGLVQHEFPLSHINIFENNRSFDPHLSVYSFPNAIHSPQKLLKETLISHERSNGKYCYKP